VVVKAIVVDLDGTVWDSRPFYAKLLCSVGTASTTSFLAKLNEGKNIVRLINETLNMGRSRFKRLCRENGKNIQIYPTVSIVAIIEPVFFAVMKPAQRAQKQSWTPLSKRHFHLLFGVNILLFLRQ
jgi:FMN phosphatase YigB (HAD superfamily)